MIYFYFILYLIVINIIGFLAMYIDKSKAKNGSYRISEKSLFVIAVLLGAIGVYIGMYKFRHKTQHKLFTVGIPLIIMLNFICIYYILSTGILIVFSNYLNL